MKRLRRPAAAGLAVCCVLLIPSPASAVTSPVGVNPGDVSILEVELPGGVGEATSSQNRSIRCVIGSNLSHQYEGQSAGQPSYGFNFNGYIDCNALMPRLRAQASLEFKTFSYESTIVVDTAGNDENSNVSSAFSIDLYHCFSECDGYWRTKTYHRFRVPIDTAGKWRFPPNCRYTSAFQDDIECVTATTFTHILD